MRPKSFRRMMLRRSINVAITILGIMTLNFFLIHMMPGEPILNMVPKDPKFDQSLRWELIDKFHLNASVPEQYMIYMYNAITLDWGTSYMANARPVLDIILNDMRWTFLLVGASTVLHDPHRDRDRCIRRL